MPSAPGRDRSAGPAAVPGLSRAGQVAVVTGGSAGLGLAIAAALAEADTTVVLASRSAERCATAAEQLSARTGAVVHGRTCGVTDQRTVGALTDRALADHGRIDMLVTSAGIQARGTVDQLAVADLRACLEVNVVGTGLACRAALLLTDPASGPSPVSSCPSTAAGPPTEPAVRRSHLPRPSSVPTDMHRIAAEAGIRVRGLRSTGESRGSPSAALAGHHG